MSSRPREFDPASADELVFTSSRLGSTYRVATSTGDAVATVRGRWWTTRWTAAGPDGARWCSGSTRRGGFSPDIDVVGPHGAPLLSFHGDFRATQRVRLPDGGRLELHGNWFSHDWTLVDRGGRPVLTATQPTRAVFRRWYDWTVWRVDPAFGVVETVAVVQAYRMFLRSVARASTRKADQVSDVQPRTPPAV